MKHRLALIAALPSSAPAIGAARRVPPSTPPLAFSGIASRPRNLGRRHRHRSPLAPRLPATSIAEDEPPLPWHRRRGIGARRGRSSSALFAAENDANEDERDEEADHATNNGEGATQADAPSKIDAPEPPRFLALGYNLAALANIIAGLVFLWNIGSITSAPMSFAVDASVAGGDMLATRYQSNLGATYAAGSLGHLLLGAGACNILSKAVRTNRLYTSGTYQRLTMGTLLFGLVGLCSLPGEAGCLPSAAMCGGAIVAAQLAKLLTAVASFVGWEYSAGGFGAPGTERLKNIVREVGRGCKSVWKAMPVTDERPATFYRTFFVLIMLGNAAFNVPELVFNLRNGTGMLSIPVGLTISSIARLGLLSSMVYALKDAAERKRLEGTTFVRLNILVGLWALGLGMAQGLADGPFNVRRAADKLLFGVLFLNNGMLSQLSKMGVICKRDEVDPDADPPLRIML